MCRYVLTVTYSQDWIDTAIRPIVVFGSEGWGFESLRARQTHSQTLDLRRQPCRVQDFRTRTVDAKT